MDPITRFQSTYMSYGDRLSEWMYGFIMVAVVVGIMGGFSDVALNSDLDYVQSYLLTVLVVLTFLAPVIAGIFLALRLVRR